MIIKRKKYSLLDKLNPGFLKYKEKKDNFWGIGNKGKDADKQFSDREKVPSDIAKKGRKSGVVQKDRKGVWRIISYKTNPPEFWNAHYDTKKSAEKALSAYHANR